MLWQRLTDFYGKYFCYKLAFKYGRSKVFKFVEDALAAIVTAKTAPTRQEILKNLGFLTYCRNE